MGLQARLMSQALRKLTGVVNKSNTACIFINQLREKVGVMFGNPEVTTGGKALKFYASMRMDVRKGETIKSGDEFLGNRTKVKIVKNKLAPPFKTAEFDLMYGTGISRTGDILDCAVEAKVVEKAGSWFSYEGQRIGQGRENVKKFLADNPEMMERIRVQAMNKLTGKEEEEPQAPAEPPKKDIFEDAFDDMPIAIEVVDEEL